MANLLEILKQRGEVQGAVMRRMGENIDSPYGLDPRIVQLIDFEQKLSEIVAQKGARLDEPAFSYLEISTFIWSEIREISQQIWQEEFEKLGMGKSNA
ncbi:hypothetical protein [Rothia nasimurium]|uniref:hypothetical protein n=1 Tax=Rothia nasimurium TaxID=85336 RepID=UPI001F3C5D8B|nr:hypothetical protein [Rothia nasimurium]